MLLTLAQAAAGATVAARLSRGRRVVGDALSDVVPATPVPIGPYGHGGRW
jgi:hypothetical protein